MSIKLIIVFLLMLMVRSDSDLQIDKTGWRKINSAAAESWPGKNVVFVKVILAAANPKSITPNHCVYKVTSGAAVMGYLYADNAMGKFDTFDFAVLFSTDLRIMSTVVLTYREEYGGEIASARWLRQFTGSTTPFEFGHNVQGISGATISARAMTAGMNNAVARMRELKSKYQL